MTLLPELTGNFIHSDELAKRWNYSPKHCLRICRIYGLNEVVMIPGGRVKLYVHEVKKLEKRLFL